MRFSALRPDPTPDALLALRNTKLGLWNDDVLTKVSGSKQTTRVNKGNEKQHTKNEP